MPLSDEERRERRREERRQERRDAKQDARDAVAGNPDEEAPKYDLQEIDRRRNWVGDQIWRAVASGNTNILKDKTALSNFLAMLRPDWFPLGDHGIVDAKEKGRHMRRLFLGDLEEEGWGMGDNGYSRAVQEYKPNWRRMVEGMQKDPKTGYYFTDGGKYYDAFGRLVKVEPPVAAAPVGSTPPPNNNPAPPGSTTTKPAPEPIPQPSQTSPNAAFYGGATPPNPYGVSHSLGVGLRNRPPSVQRRPVATPGWYSTWRF